MNDYWNERYDDDIYVPRDTATGEPDPTGPALSSAPGCVRRPVRGARPRRVRWRERRRLIRELRAEAGRDERPESG